MRAPEARHDVGDFGIGVSPREAAAAGRAANAVAAQTAQAAPAVRPYDGARIEARGLTRRAGPVTILSDVSLNIEPGEVVGIAGGSGAGKTTLLEALSGVRPADSGTVRFDSVELYSHLDAFRTELGFVPQDDIIHADLPLRSTLRYAARLRLPASTGAAAIDAAVDDAMRALDLASRAHLHVGALSGGQRKRASIAVELLTKPHVFFLDEPTSGLDPATGAELMQVLRRLANEEGATVVLTTHSPPDLLMCDRVVFLAGGGELRFEGTPEAALRYFGSTHFSEIYVRLNDVPAEETSQRFASQRATLVDVSAASPAAGAPPQSRRGAGRLRQSLVSTQRTAETMVRNRLTLAILVGSPAAVIAMYALLFQPGAFDLANPSPTVMIQIGYWVVFASFFFGLTYGLLQICSERAIVSREHMVGLKLGAYLTGKLAVLLPFLLVVNVAMLGVMRLFNRLPAESLTVYTQLWVTLSLVSAAALCLGLLASAAVGNPVQATLALPMLCFPAVLFSGAVLPVQLMGPVGVAISVTQPARWAFEAVGRDLAARDIFAHGGSPLGPPLLASYGDAGLLPTVGYWAWLVGFVVVFFVGAHVVLRRRCQAAFR